METWTISNKSPSQVMLHCQSRVHSRTNILDKWKLQRECQFRGTWGTTNVRKTRGLQRMKSVETSILRAFRYSDIQMSQLNPASWWLEYSLCHSVASMVGKCWCSETQAFCAPLRGLVPSWFLILVTAESLCYRCKRVKWSQWGPTSKCGTQYPLKSCYSWHHR